MTKKEIVKASMYFGLTFKGMLTESLSTNRKRAISTYSGFRKFVIIIFLKSCFLFLYSKEIYTYL